MRKVTITVALAIALVVVMLLLPYSVEGSMKIHHMQYNTRAYSNSNAVSATNHTMTDEEALFVVLFFSVIGLVILIGVLIQKNSVIMVQVAVSDPSDLQRDLFIISKVADSTRNRDLKFMLSETVSRLLRHPDCFCSAKSLVDVIWLVKGSWKKSFDRICDEESKQIAASNVTLRDARSCNDFAVVTILVAASGVHKLPEISSYIDLEKALAYLKSILPNYIHTVKVFWTPKDGHKKLLKKDMDEHFPLLMPLRHVEGIQWS